MKYLKRITFFAFGVIMVAKYAINYRQNKKEEKEHQLILKLLIDSDERIKKLIENENIEEKGIRFRKHPESRKNGNTSRDWEARVNNTITIPVYGNSIISSDKDMRLFYLAHELSHLINARGFEHSRPCNHVFKSCLLVEIETDLYAVKILKKIGIALNKNLWLRNFCVVRDQCKNCLEIIRKEECPTDMITEINKHFDVLDQISKLESRKIVFQEET